MNLIKSITNLIDATPNKRIYRSIISDYDLNTAICELIDNSIDNWKLHHSSKPLKIGINLDVDQQKITFKDNAGGVQESELKKLISPGESSIEGNEETIGIFGVGSKRGVVALSEFIKITTRYQKENTCRLVYDEEWLTTPDWHIVYEILTENIDESSTVIELSNLRLNISEENMIKLKNYASVTYANFLQNDKIILQINDDSIKGKSFEKWAYPPKYEPTRIIKPLKHKDQMIVFESISGLTIEKGSIGGDYGVFFYCNDRLIKRALRSPEVGFMSGVAGKPHPRMSLARIIIKLIGPSNLMPWNSSKSDINYNQPVFQAIQADIVELVKTYTALSKKLQPDFDTQISPHPIGNINEQYLNIDQKIKPSRLPAIPKIRKDYKTTLIALNKDLANKKPWIRGLYEGMIAEELISRQRILEERNRISFLILDSTLEIAFKEYLAYEIKQPLGDDKLAKIFEKRPNVHNEVKKQLIFDADVWRRIEYFYKIRCDLIHKRASSGISDHDVANFRELVKEILNSAFGIRFMEDKMS